MGRFSFLLFAFFALLLSIFYYAGRNTPIRIWDEAIYANNALEMSQSHNYVVLKNNGKASLYNTKPPLAIWMQSIAITIFGINEFSVRLPSMLAVASIFFALLFFLRRHNIHPFVQALVGMVLLSSKGFMGPHIAATGDLDALLCLWTTLFSLTIFDLLLKDDGTINKRIWLAFLFFMLAFFTKSTAVFLTLPGLMVVVISSNNWKKIIFNRATYYAIFLALTGIIGYYFLMNSLIPDYFKTVWFSEFERFYKNIMPWQAQAWNYYLYNLMDRFYPWVYVIVPAILISLKSKSKKIRIITSFSALFSFFYLLLISIPVVKLEWYDALLYPFLSLIVGMAMYEVFIFINKKIGKLAAMLVLSIPVFFSCINYAKIIGLQQNPKLESLEKEGFLVREAHKYYSSVQAKVSMSVDHQVHYDQLFFYIKKYAGERNSKIDLVPDINQLTKEDTVFVCQPEKKESIGLLYRVDTLRWDGDCLMLKIIMER